ncbi:MAG: precorrin-3B synthase, partial [Streptosporangiaceae bacterium]
MPATSPAADRAVGRTAADRCPGVLRLAEAADGYLARIRLPGGLISAGQMRVLARLAGEFGDGRVELTSRGNVQLRALAAGAAGPLTDELTPAGLLPSLSHDRVRNVLASPLAGLDGGPDLTGIVRALDAALCARPRLAELPGRFLFAVDDGRGDVAGLGADVTAVVGADDTVVNGLATQVEGPEDGIVVNGPATQGRASEDRVVAVMLACAEAFLDEAAAQGGTAWRIADLADGDERVRAAVAARLRLTAAPQPTAAPRRTAVPQTAAAAETTAAPETTAVPQTAAAAETTAAPETTANLEPTAAVAQVPARPVGLVGSGNSAAVLLAPLGRLTS